MSLTLCPVTLREANAFIGRLHRTHKPDRGCRFCLAVAVDELIVGVAVVGRPKARRFDDGWTVEATRVCTDGTKNANSKLYGAVWRAAQALGYRRLVTYTLPEEGGASLRAAGYRLIGEAGGGTWDRASRPRVDLHPTQTKLLWEAAA